MKSLRDIKQYLYLAMYDFELSVDLEATGRGLTKKELIEREFHLKHMEALRKVLSQEEVETVNKFIVSLKELGRKDESV